MPSNAGARRVQWPAVNDDAAWRELANIALQAETLAADVEESRAWEATMRELLSRQLPYEEFTEARMEALQMRLRARKLAQSNLRYRYGFKPRTAALVRRDLKRFYRRWSSG